jgi:hypothetical protein
MNPALIRLSFQGISHELLTALSPELLLRNDGSSCLRERWKQLSARTMKDLAARMSKIQFTQGLLKDMMNKCHCDTLETCGRRNLSPSRRLNDQAVAKCCTPAKALSKARVATNTK